jgi:hypothetical protein
MNLEIKKASANEKSILANLLELYAYNFKSMLFIKFLSLKSISINKQFFDGFILGFSFDHTNQFRANLFAPIFFHTP